MKYAKIIDTGRGRLWLLNAELNNFDRNKFESKKAFERFVIESMIEDVVGNYSVAHLENGAPFIEAFPKKHLSVSHSGQWMSIYWGESPLGVDVQEMTKTLMDRRDYFVNIEEEAELDVTEENLYLIWGAKEALYKKRQGSIENDKEDICIKRITKTSIEVLFNGSLHHFGYSLLDNVALVYSI